MPVVTSELLDRIREVNEFANNWIEPIPQKDMVIPVGENLWISNGNGAFMAIGLAHLEIYLPKLYLNEKEIKL